MGQRRILKLEYLKVPNLDKYSSFISTAKPLDCIYLYAAYQNKSLHEALSLAILHCIKTPLSFYKSCL